MDSRYKDRETLKSYFRKGNVPTEEQFAALIDSVHNIREDGQTAVPEKDSPASPDPPETTRESPETGDAMEIRADGYWHDLPVEAAADMGAAGCRVYRLSACYLNRLSKSYSECGATASHSEGRKCRVCSPRKHWWGWSGHIKIRWQRRDGKLYLQMKCRNVQKGSENIFCRIETLWNL